MDYVNWFNNIRSHSKNNGMAPVKYKEQFSAITFKKIA